MELHSRARAIAIAAKDEIDWHSVYVELLPRVFHYFAYRVGDAQLAEDLAAATFERAWRKRNRYRKDLGPFHGWVFGIARKVAAEHFRRSKLNQVEIEVNETIAYGKDIEKAFEKNVDFAKLRQLLTYLGDEDRGCCR